MNLSNHSIVVKDLLMQEIWKAVIDFYGYEVSDFGRVRSWLATADEPRIRKLTRDKDGYLCLNMMKDGKPFNRKVHRLVLEAFIGPCPEGQEVRHRNGKRDDNRLENLCWGTKAEQAVDKVKHGTVLRGDQHPSKTKPAYMPHGENHCCAKLTEVDVRDIRTLLDEGEFSQYEIADAYEVRQSTIHRIKTGKAWKHI